MTARPLSTWKGVAHNQLDPSAHLAFNLGVARYRCGEFAKALDALVRAIEIEPDHALALDVAAHCAFLTGDARTARRLAKRANALGQSEAYREWRKGKYRPSGGRS